MQCFSQTHTVSHPVSYRKRKLVLSLFSCFALNAGQHQPKRACKNTRRATGKDALRAFSFSFFYFPGTFCAFRAGLPAAQLPQALQPAQAPQEAQLPPQERLPAFRSRIMPRSSSATSSVIARISAIFTKLAESQADIRSDPFGKCGGAGGKRSEKPHGAAEWRGEII